MHRLAAGAVFLALFCSFIRLAGPRSSTPRVVPFPPVSDQKAQARWRDFDGKLPLSFEPNLGQTDTRVRFLSRGGGYTLYLTPGEAVLAMQKGESRGENRRARTSDEKSPIVAPAPSSRPQALALRGAVTGHSSLAAPFLGLRFVGADPAPKIAGLDELPGKSNYFIGSDPGKWRRNVPTYAKVQYKAVYPGVDLIYYGNHGQLECDFVIAPGADYRAVRLAIEGAEKLRVDERGDLVMQLGDGEIRLRRPVIYQPTAKRGRLMAFRGLGNTDARDKDFINGGYTLAGEREVAFRIGAFDRTRPLVIDPVLFYSTYLGGMAAEVGNGIAVDTNGAVYVTGTTASTDFPTAPTSGVLQAASGGGTDVFVTKIDTIQSTALVYSTYLGGSGNDSGNAIAVDGTGAAYVTGLTSSTNFPITPGTALQTTLGGPSDAFLTKIDPTGTMLVYSTYLGGAGADAGFGIAVDSTGAAYVTGQTNSSNFPITSGTAFQRALNGPTDAFVTKIDTTKSGTSSLVYSTYLGGSGDEAGNGIAVDSSNAYVVGSTVSADFPIKNPFQPAFGGGTCGTSPCPDAFVTRIDTTQTGPASLVYSTFLGNNRSDIGFGVAVGGGGTVYVTGQTASPFPTTTGAFQTTPGGGFDAFVSKIDTTKTGNPSPSLIYSTYLGGSGDDAATGIAADASGNVYVAGTTKSSTNFPLASPAQATFGGGASDTFVAKLNADGSTLIFSTYLGGSRDDAASAITVDSGGAASVTGQTTSTDFPTQRPFQMANNGASDAFVTKLAGLALPVASLSPSSLPPFANQMVGTTSVSQSITLSNKGDADLALSAPPAFTGANSSDFVLSDGTTCSTTNSVKAGATCSIKVSFSPIATGARAAALSIADNATGSPHTAALSGTGVPNPDPVVRPNPTNLPFGSVILGATSAVQTVTLTNIGGRNLSISAIAVAGVNSGDFAVTPAGTTCSPSNPVVPGASCNISVTFTPRATGTRVAALSITDNAAGSPHSIPLAGSGGDFSVSSGSASATVAAGSSATYNLSVAPVGGFSQEVTLSCNASVTASTCTVSPTSVTPAGPTAATATVTVTTTSRSIIAPRRPPAAPFGFGPWTPPSVVWLLALISLAGALGLRLAKRRRTSLVWGMAVLCVLLWASCGSHGGGGGGAQGTPAGNYSLTLTGTTATTPVLTHSATVTLVVN